MPRERLTRSQLAVISSCINRYRGFPLRVAARESGYNVGTIAKARFLMKCKPIEWVMILGGEQSLESTYRRYKGSRQTNSFEE